MHITTHAEVARETSAAHVDEVDVAAAEITELLATRFAVRPTAVRALGAESAAVFRVEVDGGALAVKAFWGDTPSNVAVRWQQDVVHRLAESGLPVARPRRSVDGETTVDSSVRGRSVLVQVSDWLTGTPVEAVPMRRRLLREIGHVAARLHESLRDETAPPELDDHAWQITGVRAAIEQALARIHVIRGRGGLPGTAEEIARLQRAVDTASAVLDERVEPRLRTLPTAVVHHDLHDANLLVGLGAGPTSVTGILDFGDMTCSARISEPVIAGAYAARHRLDPVAAVTEVVDAWSESVPVTSEEAAVVRPLAAARLLANSAVWMSRLDTARGDYAAARRRGSLVAAERLLEGL